jgi:hypothetical protein
VLCKVRYVQISYRQSEIKLEHFFIYFDFFLRISRKELCAAQGGGFIDAEFLRKIFQRVPSPLEGEGGRRLDEGYPIVHFKKVFYLKLITPHPPVGHLLPQGEKALLICFFKSFGT